MEDPLHFLFPLFCYDFSFWVEVWTITSFSTVSVVAAKYFFLWCLLLIIILIWLFPVLLLTIHQLLFMFHLISCLVFLLDQAIFWMYIFASFSFTVVVDTIMLKGTIIFGTELSMPTRFWFRFMPLFIGHAFIFFC